MTSGANDEWVRQGTPHDDNADWNEEQSEYGTAMSPTEWDDYSSEQAVPVAPPRAQADNGIATAPSPISLSEREHEPVPGQEPYAAPDYRSDDTGLARDDEPAADADADAYADDDGMEPARIDTVDAPVAAVSVPADDAPFAEVHDDEVTRARPIVSDAQLAELDETRDVGTAEVNDGNVGGGNVGVVHDALPDLRETTPDVPVTQEVAETPVLESAASDERHVDAADYLAVDPVSVESLQEEHTDPVLEDVDDVQDAVPLSHVDEEPMNDNRVDDDATQALPVAAAVAGGATMASMEPRGTVPDGLYRASGNEETAVIAPDEYPTVDAEVAEERRQAELDAERQAREQRLGVVPTSTDNAMREDVGPPRVTTDRFFPSFGLFVLRIVVAGVLGFSSYQILGSGVNSTADFLTGYPLIPEPRLVAWILGFTLGAMALLLVIGLLQRVVGFLLLAIAVCSLVFIRWGKFAIISSGTEGFIGDKDLLLAAIGLLLLTIGGGAWGIDGAFRKSRADARAERQG